MKVTTPAAALIAILTAAPGAIAGPAAYGICQVSIYNQTLLPSCPISTTPLPPVSLFFW